MDEFVVSTLSELVEFIKEASPALWAIAQRQVLADMVSYALWLLALTVPLVACAKWHKWAKNAKNIFDDAEHRYFAIAFGAMLAIIILIIANSILRIAINPDYYAIRTLAQMITQ